MLRALLCAVVCTFVFSSAKADTFTLTSGAFIDSLTRAPRLDRTALHQALSEYATQHAGTDADLDPDLETAAIDLH